jgi:carboxyl-terminal processing protease
MFVEKGSMDVFEDDEEILRESDLDQSLQSDKVSEQQLPVEELHYVYVKPGEKDGKCPPRVEEIIEDDWEVKAAAKMLKSVSTANRPKMIQQLSPVFQDIRGNQDDKLVKELRKLKIDWERCGETPPGEAQDLEITFLQDGEKVDRFEAEAGSEVEITLMVENRSKTGTFCRLHAMTESDNRVLSGRELLIGKLRPGQKKSWTSRIEIPRHLPSRVDPITFTFHEQRGVAPRPVETRLAVEAPPEPSYATSWQILDDIAGDGDGVLERGETGRLRVHVKNIGKGTSLSTATSIKNVSGKALFIHKGRAEIKDLEPGERAHVDFKLELTGDYDAEAYQLKLSVVDMDRAGSLREKIEIDAVRSPDAPVEDVSGTWTVTAEQAAVLPFASPSVALMATLPKATTVRADARVGDLLRVVLPDDSWGFVKAEDLEKTGKKPSGKLDELLDMAWTLDLPEIVIDGFDPPVGEDGDWTVREETITLEGHATDAKRIKDMYIYLGDEKVFYKSNPTSTDPGSLHFETTLELGPGVNYLLVTVRESPLLVRRELFVIRRDNPDGTTMETPDKKLIP